MEQSRNEEGYQKSNTLYNMMKIKIKNIFRNQRNNISKVLWIIFYMIIYSLG